MRKIVFTLKGGPGSGHVGHAGRPGSVGGSTPGTGGAISAPTDSAFRHGQLKYARGEHKYIEGIVRVLPQEHLDMVGSISTGGRSSDTAGECEPGGYITLFATFTGRRMWDKDVVRHEIGHAVLFHGTKYGDRPLKDFRKLYSNLARAVGKTRGQLDERYRSGKPRARPVKGFPTAYSQISAHELFAESYDLYVAKPASLLKRSPDVYNYMRDTVFNGVEYLESK